MRCRAIQTSRPRHDQIGNRAAGERLHQLCGIDRAKRRSCPEHYFRPNTLDAKGCSSVELARYAEKTSPIGGATLLAGDCLYIPSCWWHVALCTVDALWISVVVLPYPKAGAT